MSEEAGEWKDYDYRDDEEGHCHYFLTGGATRDQVRQVYEEIMDCCLLPALPIEPGPAIALHYRKFIAWEKAPPEFCVEMASWLADRTGVARVLVASDHDPTAEEILIQLEERGLRSEVLAAGSGLAGDFDRDEQRVRDFVQVWRTLTSCRWAVSNAISSTVLDASRALGHEVWSFGSVGARTDNRCEFFTRFGFDALTIPSREE
ncbi:hypothetical protein [Roseibacillus ishigakijimensis]|uniref:Uncharacterized protein n=1 Tax=Roseibacillus ishigakijimensis TaxID=454146 RepID=A0A934RT30_9BACT|nr:hypothetical protein [Roseibacillus ishigakijimensis]MBK1835422.1 hypothetical protein [Roseibacillus ishigakijimensis]